MPQMRLVNAKAKVIVQTFGLIKISVRISTLRTKTLEKLSNHNPIIHIRNQLVAELE